MPSHSRNTSSGSNQSSSQASDTMSTPLETRKLTVSKSLSVSWEGDDWLPADVRSRCRWPLSYRALQCIERATTAAQGQNSPLAFLWSPKGPLRVAFDSSAQKLSSDFCTLADQLVLEWARIGSRLTPPQAEPGSDKQFQEIVNQISPNENASGTLSTGAAGRRNKNRVKKSGEKLLPPKFLKPFIAGDLPLRVQTDIDTSRQLLDDAYSRKKKAEWAIKASKTQLQELTSLFHTDDEEPAPDDEVMRDAGADADGAHLTRIERDLLEAEIRRETEEVKKADSDIEKYKREVVVSTRIIECFNNACFRLPHFPQ